MILLSFDSNDTFNGNAWVMVIAAKSGGDREFPATSEPAEPAKIFDDVFQTRYRFQKLRAYRELRRPRSLRGIRTLRIYSGDSGSPPGAERLMRSRCGMVAGVQQRRTSPGHTGDLSACWKITHSLAKSRISILFRGVSRPGLDSTHNLSCPGTSSSLFS